MKLKNLLLILTVYNFSSLAAGEFTVDSNTVALWHFNEGTGDTVYDVSGNGNNGVIYGADWANGRFGKGLYFDGTDSVVVLDSPSLKPIDEITIEMYIRPDTNTWGALLYKWVYPALGPGYAFGLDQTTVGGAISTTSNYYNHFQATNAVDWNQVWYKVKMYYEDPSIRLYVNDSLVSKTTVTGSLVHNDLNLTMGFRNDGGPPFPSGFRGIIDEVRISSIARTSDCFGSALNFDVVNAYVEVPDSPILSAIGPQFTIEYALKINAYPSGVTEVFSKWGEGSTEDDEFVTNLHPDGTLECVVSGLSGQDILYSDTIPIGTWVHIAEIFDSTTTSHKLFVNGNLEVTNIVSSILLMNRDTNQPFWIGQYHPISQHNISLDEFRIWNIARSQSEIEATMNAELTGIKPGLIGYWKFNEGTGQITGDSSGNGQDGRLGSTLGIDGSDPTWIICTSNSAPFLDLLDPKSVNEGSGLSFGLYATDPDTDIITLSVLNPPQNSNLSDSGNGTGVFSFEPDTTQAGSYNVTFIASDGFLADSQTVEITVNNCEAIPGDVNASGTLTLSDIIATVNYTFNKPGYPACSFNSSFCWLSGLLCRGDWGGGDGVSLADVIQGVNYIFNKPGGPWDAVPSGTCCLPVP